MDSAKRPATCTNTIILDHIDLPQSHLTLLGKCLFRMSCALCLRSLAASLRLSPVVGGSGAEQPWLWGERCLGCGIRSPFSPPALTHSRHAKEATTTMTAWCCMHHFRLLMGAVLLDDVYGPGLAQKDGVQLQAELLAAGPLAGQL